MDNLTFIQKVIETLTWPITLLMALTILKDPLSKIVSSVSRLKYKDLEVEITKKDIKDLKPNLKEIDLSENFLNIGNLQNIKILASISTRSAITESWQNLEIKIYKSANIPDIAKRPKGQSFSKVLLTLSESGAINESTLEIIKKLREIRNRVVHLDNEDLTEEEAINYALNCEQIMATLSIVQKVA